MVPTKLNSIYYKKLLNFRNEIMLCMVNSSPDDELPKEIIESYSSILSVCASLKFFMDRFRFSTNHHSFNVELAYVAFAEICDLLDNLSNTIFNNPSYFNQKRLALVYNRASKQADKLARCGGILCRFQSWFKYSHFVLKNSD